MASNGAMSDRELFVLTLRPERHTNGLQALRLALKALLRNHGLRCVSIRIELGDDRPVLEESTQGRVASQVVGAAHGQNPE